MRPHRRKRLYKIIGMLAGISFSIFLLLYALRQNISLYYTPSQAISLHLKNHPTMRIGGIVAKNSIAYEQKSALVIFAITDFHRKIWIHYHGVLPSLFREGQGIVVQGRLHDSNIFQATEVLAKHDETYHPKGISSQ